MNWKKTVARRWRLLMVLMMVAGPGRAEVEQWGVFEAAFQGPARGNPFTDVRFSATFSGAGTRFVTEGFYDGDGTYRVRFMPPSPGAWQFATASSCPELDGRTGSFTVVPAAAGNHGPVRVAHTYHFAYADGTPYRELGTTCYAWIHQPESLQSETLNAC